MTRNRFVIFGPSGSGKSSIAEALARNNRISSIEISRDILPLVDTDASAPDTDTTFRDVSSSPRDYTYRRRARVLFDQFLKSEQRPHVAMLVEQLVNLQHYGKTIIVTGLRGQLNLRNLKDHGYTLIQLVGDPDIFAQRQAARDGVALSVVHQDQKEESRLFEPATMMALADFILDTTLVRLAEATRRIQNFILTRSETIGWQTWVDTDLYTHCRICLNNSRMPGISISETGLCNICEAYQRCRAIAPMEDLGKLVNDIRGSGSGPIDALLGLSGGKDSTAAAWSAKELGIKFEGFSLDIGYYPPHTFSRARWVCDHLGYDHNIYDIRHNMTDNIRLSYEKTADLFDMDVSPHSRSEFRKLYAEARKNYSIRADKVMAYPRVCQLCRRTVIRSYYEIAQRKNVKFVLLGINEWAGLSTFVSGSPNSISGVRKLQPSPDARPIYIVHLPFLQNATLSSTIREISEIEWRPPEGEDVVESNSNSCLFARAAEEKATLNLGFHPDTSRLSREITCGFLPRAVAIRALSKCHLSPWSVREVLQSAGFVGD